MIVLIVAFTVLFIGIALLILPGPAFIVIPVGLGILATELPWARNILEKFKHLLQRKQDGKRPDTPHQAVRRR